MALDNGKDAVDSAKVIHVESVDETMNTTLTRDSAMEMELLELFEDITLEEVVANRACVGKVIGCKDMPASVVKKILTEVWRRLGPWRMKKCDEGVLGFFFENEDDCAFVLDKRPWLVNGVCLSNDNAPIVEKKVGSFVLADDRSKTELVRRGYIRAWIDVWVAHPFPARFFLTTDGKPESWVQFKYEKLPHLCFNCGRLAHWDKTYHVPMAMVTPKMGKAVQMYGSWIKSETGKSNCFTGKGSTRLVIETMTIPEWELNKKRSLGTWKRRNPSEKKGGPEAIEKGKELVSAVEWTSVPEVVSCHSPRRLHGCTDPYDGLEERGDRENVRNRIEGRCNVDDVDAVQMPPRGELEARVPPSIGPNFLNLPQPDFALVNNDESIPDIGPTLAQYSEAQKLFFQLYGPDFLNLYKAQQSIICNPPDLSEMITHLLGNNRKRKAHCWLQPFPASPHFELPDCPVKEKGSDHDKTGAFCMGSTVKGEGSIGNRRGRKPKGKEKKRSGLCRPSAERTLRGLIHQCNADLIFPAETKVDGNRMTEISNRLGFANVCCIPSLRTAGGFCVAWSLGVQCHVIETFEVGFKIEVADCNSPWVVMGDLNVILNDFEKAGGRRYNRKEGRKRLDRAIADANWCMEFSRARVSSFPILGLDHAPIVLNVWGDQAKLKYPFCFLEVWTTRPDCGDVVSQAWQGMLSTSLLEKKLKEATGTDSK
ncbi:hypothetical protein F8388_024979 [Cannabis sativa]|uniref:Zinc knuckle CX2CX4HX4C domain-containing protein n=1 Tax=Cannabis sativa TaxID=3483 RepID=A0A7J6G3Q0_CANSA|nr:hypothetical protein F8388_024979 [Cannabis sativa]